MGISATLALAESTHGHHPSGFRTNHSAIIAAATLMLLLLLQIISSIVQPLYLIYSKETGKVDHEQLLNRQTAKSFENDLTNKIIR